MDPFLFILVNFYFLAGLFLIFSYNRLVNGKTFLLPAIVGCILGIGCSTLLSLALASNYYWGFAFINIIMLTGYIIALILTIIWRNK